MGVYTVEDPAQVNKDNVVSLGEECRGFLSLSVVCCCVIFCCCLLLMLLLFMFYFPYFVFPIYGISKNFHLLDLLFILFWAFAFNFRDRGGFISFHNSLSFFWL